jgi:hypothetical protein
LTAAKDAIGEIVQQVQIRGRGIRRETAVADYLCSDSLSRFLAPIFEYLEVGVAVRVNEAGSDSQAAAVNHACVCGGFERVNLGDGIAGNEQISAPRRRAAAIN